MLRCLPGHPSHGVRAEFDILLDAKPNVVRKLTIRPVEIAQAEALLVYAEHLRVGALQRGQGAGAVASKPVKPVGVHRRSVIDGQAAGDAWIEINFQPGRVKPNPILVAAGAEAEAVVVALFKHAQD